MPALHDDTDRDGVATVTVVEVAGACVVALIGEHDYAVAERIGHVLRRAPRSGS